MLTALKKIRIKQLRCAVEHFLAEGDFDCRCPACGRPLVCESTEVGGMVYCTRCNTAMAYRPDEVGIAADSGEV